MLPELRSAMICHMCNHSLVNKQFVYNHFTSNLRNGVSSKFVVFLPFPLFLSEVGKWHGAFQFRQLQTSLSEPVSKLIQIARAYYPHCAHLARSCVACIFIRLAPCPWLHSACSGSQGMWDLSSKLPDMARRIAQTSCTLPRFLPVITHNMYPICSFTVFKPRQVFFTFCGSSLASYPFGATAWTHQVLCAGSDLVS